MSIHSPPSATPNQWSAPSRQSSTPFRRAAWRSSQRRRSAPSPPPSVGQASMSSAPVRLVSASRWRVSQCPALAARWGGAGAWSAGQDDLGRSRNQRSVPRDSRDRRRSTGPAAVASQRSGARRDHPQPRHPAGIALETRSSRSHSRTRFDSGCKMQSGAASTTRPPARKDMGAGHFDHVHITTTGGGYPTGGEIYVR